MVVIHETEDGNWIIEGDWMIPREVSIENGAIHALRDELVRVFGYPPEGPTPNIIPGG